MSFVGRKKWKRDSSNGRERPQKRSPPRDHDYWHNNESYYNRDRRRSRSRPRRSDDERDTERGRNNSRPPSILKKNVRFPAEERRGRGRGHGGRGRQSGRGGRGDARDGYRRERGSRT